MSVNVVTPVSVKVAVNGTGINRQSLRVATAGEGGVGSNPLIDVILGEGIAPRAGGLVAGIKSVVAPRRSHPSSCPEG